MEHYDGLPQPLWIKNDPVIVFRIPGPEQGGDAVIKSRIAEKAIDQPPELIDEELPGPSGQGFLKGLPGADGVQQAKDAEGGERGAVTAEE